MVGCESTLSGVAVFDIVNAGPRNRFVVRGSNGELLIVHNCNGFVYGEDRRPHPIHDAKIEALESIVEEANGMPVLVSYQFVEDLAMIKRAFPKAKGIDETNEDEWNAGRVPMLVCHPASAGHGLNLQWGSNILVDYSSGWNLEHDDQIIERIGPMRQYQAGLDRPVYRYRIMARDTVDLMVKERRASKRSVQEILLEAMKRA
jgi:SNF2 family DNA or RNA helicase